MIGIIPPRPLPADPPIPPAPAAPDAPAVPHAPPIPFPVGEVDARLKPLQPPSAMAATIVREPTVDRPMGASNRAIAPTSALWSDNGVLRQLRATVSRPLRRAGENKDPSAHERDQASLAPPSAGVKTRVVCGAARWSGRGAAFARGAPWMTSIGVRVPSSHRVATDACVRRSLN